MKAVRQIDLLDELWTAQGVAASTRRQRRYVAAALAKACDGDLAGLTPEVVVGYMAAKPYKPSSRAVAFSTIATIGKSLVRLGILDADPTAGLLKPRTPARAPRPLTREQVRTLLDTLPDPERSWLILAAYAGLRCAEVAGVRGDDLELRDAGWQIRVRGKGGTELTVPAHPEVVRLLSTSGTQGQLWPYETATSVSRRFRDAARRAGVDVGLHRARHSFATAALRSSGGNLLVVQRLCRHSSPRTTMGYAAIDDDEATSAVLGIKVS